jgi:NADPH:quinone reductase-like Zn-dependent oxidoreductase
VGIFAVQLARIHGAYVIATSSQQRVETARMLGADDVIDHAATDFTSIEPVDLVFDTAGGDRLTRSVDVLKPGGRLVSVAERPSQELCDEHGVEGAFFIVEPNRNQLIELARLADRGALQVLIDQTYPLSDARKAFDHVMSRGGGGKVVLTVTGVG